jgi:hypothetical protein
MTIFAFPFFYFIKNISVIVISNLLVAFCASHILMFPIKFEGSSIVIEMLNFPIIKCMTFYAISQTIDIKLFKMGVLMAIRTGLRHMSKLLNCLPGTVGLIMACTARNLASLPPGPPSVSPDLR